MTQEQAQRERFVRVCRAKLAQAEESVEKARREVREQTDLLRIAEKQLAELVGETVPDAGS